MPKRVVKYLITYTFILFFKLALVLKIGQEASNHFHSDIRQFRYVIFIEKNINSAKALRKCTAYPVRCKYFSKATSSHSSRIYGNRSSRQYHRPDPLGLSVAVLLTYPHHIQVFADIPQILNLPLPYPKPNSMFDYIYRLNITKKLPGIDTEQFILFTLSKNTHNKIFGFSTIKFFLQV